MSILRQDSVFKTRLQDLKKNSSLNSNERQGVNVEDDNDFIHPPNVCLTGVGCNFYRLRRSIGRVQESISTTRGLFSENAVQTKSVFWHTSWNALPLSLRDVPTLSQFKRGIKKALF